MRFTITKKKEPIDQWHEWYAWHCVEIDGLRVIWESVMRRGTWVDNPDYGLTYHNTESPGWWVWEYKLIND